jgi:hypothetical protein
MAVAPGRGKGNAAPKSWNGEDEIPLDTSSFSAARPCYFFRTKYFLILALKGEFRLHKRKE